MTHSDRLPLSALLSQALVAFTIEFDNEAERQLPNRTTRHGGTKRGVWLVSMVMWLNCMRYLGAEPVRVGDIVRLARATTNLDGMRRWGYLTLERDPADRRPKPPGRDLLARATPRGLRAREVWEPLTATIEDRWRTRFGAGPVTDLAAALRQLAAQLPAWLPDCLPILGYGLLSIGSQGKADRYRLADAALGPAPAGDAAVSALPLPWLLARVLLAVAIQFERAAALSLALSADLLRVLGPDGGRVRDLPARSGVSTESLAMATKLAGSLGLAVVGTDPAGGRWKNVTPTAKGNEAQRAYLDVTARIEDDWRVRLGDPAVTALRSALEGLVGTGGPESALFAGLEPDPAGWRARVRPPTALPHFPMVLHRGGYPDGS